MKRRQILLAAVIICIVSVLSFAFILNSLDFFNQKSAEPKILQENIGSVMSRVEALYISTNSTGIRPEFARLQVSVQ